MTRHLITIHGDHPVGDLCQLLLDIGDLWDHAEVRHALGGLEVWGDPQQPAVPGAVAPGNPAAEPPRTQANPRIGKTVSEEAVQAELDREQIADLLDTAADATRTLIPTVKPAATDEVTKPEAPQVYPCAEPGCAKTFPTDKALQGHLNAHRGPLTHLCRHPGCDLKFRSKGGRQDHELLAHGRQPWDGATTGPTPEPTPRADPPPEPARPADDAFPRDLEPKPYPCTEPGCTARFRTQQALGGHLGAHRAAERTHQCDDCGRTFGGPQGLAAHQRHCPPTPAAPPPAPVRPQVGEPYADFLARKAAG